MKFLFSSVEYEVKAEGTFLKKVRCGRYDGCFPDSLGYSKAMTMWSFLTMSHGDVDDMGPKCASIVPSEWT